MRLLILVVLYGRACRASETLRSLAACRAALEDSSLVVWDNSPQPVAEEEKQWLRRAFPRVAYFHDPANPGLGEVYNRIIARYLKPKMPELFDYMILFDHDSEIDPTFFAELERACGAHPDISLFLPLVLAHGHIVSPANFFVCKGFYWKKRRSGLTRARHRTAINSGMVISVPYLRDRFRGYDERLRSYGTDNFFMQEYGKTNRQFVVLNCVVAHDLACFGPETVDMKLRRHQESINTVCLLNQGGGFRLWLARVYCQVRKLRLAIRYRDRRFLT